MIKGKSQNRASRLTNNSGTISDLENVNNIADATLLSIRRKYRNKDVKQFVKNATEVISSLTSEEQGSDNLHDIIVNKIGGVTEYTVDDEGFYRAVKELLGTPGMKTKMQEMLVKYTVTNEEATFTICDLLAGMTVADLKSKQFLDILEGKIGDIISDKAQNLSESDTKGTGSESTKRKLLSADLDGIQYIGMSLKRMRITVAELKGKKHIENLNAKMKDISLDEAQKSRNSGSDTRGTDSEGVKRKALLAHLDGIPCIGMSFKRMRNAKRLRESLTLYEGQNLNIVSKLKEKNVEITELYEKQLIFGPAMLTLRRKFINEDNAKFFVRTVNIVSALTTEDLQRDDLHVAIIRKSGDGVEYTAEDDEYFKAFKALANNADLMANVKKAGEKNHPMDSDSEISDVAPQVKMNFIAGLTIAELKSQHFLEILEAKIDGFFLNKIKELQ